MFFFILNYDPINVYGIRRLVNFFLLSQLRGNSCSCCGQVLNLTQFIEDGFENKLKTSAVFVDLTAAYDAVNHRVLLFKVAKVVKNSTVVWTTESLLNTRVSM